MMQISSSQSLLLMLDMPPRLLSTTPLVSPKVSRLLYVSPRCHDPVLTKQKAQFNGMPKIFEWSKTEDMKVLDNPEVVRHPFTT